jgi:arabinofuranosyltransferase
MCDEAQPKRSFLTKTVLLAAILVVAIAFVKTLVCTAWVCDDAYITYRTVDNFVHGYGLTWNTDERVQGFTHPLWMFVMSGAYCISREMFLTSISVSITLTLIAILILACRVAKNRSIALLTITTLLFSRAFMDYSTSGLENPLTHMLLVVFVAIFFRGQCRPRTIFLLSLTAALTVLNRMDTLLLVTPALAYAWLGQRTRKATAALLLGFLPFLLWELFSVVYYGFPFPNTAYAKLGSGIPGGDLMRQGGYYFLHTLLNDPITLPILLLGMLTPFLFRDRKFAPLALGIALYLVYILKIGGDFMAGRFFAAPFLLAVLALARWPKTHTLLGWSPVFAVVILASLARPYAPIVTGAAFGQDKRGFKDAHGIGDERKFYYQTCGLLRWMPTLEMPTHPYTTEGKNERTRGEKVVLHGSVGFRGYYAGPGVHIIDYYALTDPLLARIPARYDAAWRIGHFLREVPLGYRETARAGKNLLQDPKLAQFYDQLDRIIRGPIWSRDRWRAIWNMNRGAYRDLFDADQYRFPGLKKIALAQVSTPKAVGAPWNAPGNQTFAQRGLHIDLGGLQHAAHAEASLDSNDPYELLFMRDATVLGKVDAGPYKGQPGLMVYDVPVPAKAVKEGYNAIRVMPYPAGKNEKFSLGHLTLAP